MAFSLSGFGNRGVAPSYADMIGAANLLQPFATSLSSSGTTDTLSAQQIGSGLFQRSGASTAVTSTTDTAAALITGMDLSTGNTFLLFYSNKNTASGAVTLAAGTGVTLSGTTVIPVGATVVLSGQMTSATTVSLSGVAAFAGGVGGSGVSGEGAFETNTALTTAGNGTWTAAGIDGRLITRTGPVAAYTDTTDTAANIIAGFPGAVAGQSFEMTFRNTVPFVATLAGGTGVTLSGNTVISPNSALKALVTFTSLTAVTIVGLSTYPLALKTLQVVTALNTVGAGTITAAGISGGVTTRGGSQSAAPFTDTTDTATNIIAAQPSAMIGQSWEYTYQNGTNAAATITGGTGVTLSGVTVVPANSYVKYLLTYTAAATITMAAMAMGRNASLAATQFVSISAGNGTLSAGNMEGAQYCVLATSGATAFTTRTAAQIIAGVPNAQIGDSYTLRVYNTNGGTLTLTGGTGVTITGTATIATNVTRDYLVSVTGASTVTMQNIGSGVAN